MYDKVDIFEKVENYIQAQQEKIDSWLPFDDVIIPYGIVERQEQEKINVIRMVLKMLLINTKYVLKGLVICRIFCTVFLKVNEKVDTRVREFDNYIFQSFSETCNQEMNGFFCCNRSQSI